ncbi:MAG: hypothetical protein QM529_03415 [Hydrotalea sp.]|nr:hypothetical protein [Hydrotalea sp.]
MTLKKLLIIIIYSFSFVAVWWTPTYIGYYLSQANRTAKQLRHDVLALREENSRLEIAYSDLSSPSSVATLTAKFLPDMRPTHEAQFVSRQWFFDNRLVYNPDDNRRALDNIDNGQLTNDSDKTLQQ